MYFNLILMENIKKNINEQFKKFIVKDEHPFFKDIKKVNKIADNFLKYQNNFIINKIEYKEDIKIPDEVKINLDKCCDELKIDNLKQLNKEMQKSNNYLNIFKIVTKISKYIIKDNNVEINDNNKTVMIIGAGPIGLFMACYLKITFDNINVIIYDNKINKTGFRKPYTRVRPFSTSSKYLSLIIPKLYCLTNYNYIFINIFLLEYLLYSKAILDYNIPIYYRDYDWNDYLNIIEKNNIDVVFDCTGGRLKTDIFNNIDTSWIEDPKFIINEDINKQLYINKEENLVHLIDYPKDKIFKKNHFYGSLNIYNKQHEYVDKIDIDILNVKDVHFFTKLKKKNFSYENVIEIIKGINSDISRNYIYNILMDNIKKYDEYYFNFDIWGIYIRHTIQPCEIFNNNKLYISIGDSMFHSHYITGSGLNRTIKLAVYCANQLVNILI